MLDLILQIPDLHPHAHRLPLLHPALVLLPARPLLRHAQPQRRERRVRPRRHRVPECALVEFVGRAAVRVVAADFCRLVWARKNVSFGGLGGPFVRAVGVEELGGGVAEGGGRQGEEGEERGVGELHFLV